MKIYETLEAQLKKENDFVTDDGELKKWVVISKAQNADETLIALLLDSPELKDRFFKEIKGALVFRQSDFVRFLEQKNFLNDSYTAYRNKVGLTIDDKLMTQRNEVALVWPFKDCVLEGGQSREEDKREEIFFNEILAQDEITQLLEPKTLTNAKIFDRDGEKPFEHFTRDAELNEQRGIPEDTITDNLIVKGNNLLALHSIQAAFAERVKLIYIDPPYNTQGDANTFGYNNSFNHSTWLTFMKSRLEVSRTILKRDGVIAIAIDDEEYAHLKVLADDVFGRENYMGTLIVQIKPSGRTNDAYFATCHEYVLFYSKEPQAPTINFFALTDKQKDLYSEGNGEESFKWRDFLRTGGFSTPEERPNSYYPIYFDPKSEKISLKNEGKEFVEILPIDRSNKKRVWRKTQPSFLEHLDANEIKISPRSDGSYKVQIIDRIKEGMRPKSIWVDSKYDASSHGTKLLKNLFNGEKLFSFPKSLYSVRDIVELFTEREGSDIVLDFFGGSATTAHAVLDLNLSDSGNRQFVVIEQLDYILDVSAKRVCKVIEKIGSGSFTYFELKKYNQDFIDQIEAAADSKALLKIWQAMKAKSFLNYNVDLKKQDEHLDDFKALALADQKAHLVSLLDKNQLYVNLSSMGDKGFDCSAAEKLVTRDFYQIDK